MMVARSVGKFKKERTLDRHSRARCFFCERVEIEHQPVALFDKSFADRFGLRATDPRFMVASPFLGMIPVDGLERGNLKPFGEQGLLRCSCASANVRSSERKATQSKIFEHRRCQPTMTRRGHV